jgi:hypothetical protein
MAQTDSLHEPLGNFTDSGYILKENLLQLRPYYSNDIPLSACLGLKNIGRKNDRNVQ